MTPEQKVKLNQLIQSVESLYHQFRNAPDNTPEEFNSITALMDARRRLRDYVESLTCSR